MPATRTSLIQRIRSLNDKESWEQFAGIYRPVIERIARRRGIPADERHDVVQEVFVRLVRDTPQLSYQQSKGRFRTWLSRIAHNVMTDWFRRQHKRPIGLADPGLVPDAEMGCSGSAHEFRMDLVQQALRAVKQQTRTSTWLCFEEHCLKRQPASLVAQNLSLSVNAVYVNTSRVLAQVRELCHAHEETSDDLDHLPV